jgi:hypothetical protein
MSLYFSPEAEMERMRRENVRDTEMRLVILGDGLGGANSNLYADDNHVWVRDTANSIPYKALAGNGPTPEINKQVWIRWESGPEEYRVHMSDPGHMAATGRSMHLENASDPHNQFHTTEQILTLKSLPVGGGYVNVYGWQYVNKDGLYSDYKGSSAATVTAAISHHIYIPDYAPVTAGHHAYALLAFNDTKFQAGVDDPIDVFVSTSKAWTPGTLGKADIQECLDQMAPHSTRIKVYRVFTGMTADDVRGHDDDRDIRPWLNEEIQDESVTLPKLANDVLHIATVAPAVTDDSGDGYAVGSRWINTTTGAEYVAMDVSVGAAVWTETTSSGGGGGITALTGDVTAGPGSGSQATTLATVNSNVGSFTNASITVNAKGLITAASSGSASTAGYILIQDQKSIGGQGGGFTSGADQVRTLNTIVADTVSIGSLSSNRFTLPAGTYRIRVDCPAFNVGSHQAFLYNFTDSSVVARGTSAYCLNTSNSQTVSTISTRFTIAGSKAFEVRHRCGVTRGTDGFGVAAGNGTEVYTIVEIIKE